MSNTSATGGYISGVEAALPGGLSFQQFVQSIFVGISGLPGELVRPKWQLNAPKQPSVGTNWIAVGLPLNDDADTNAYSGVDANGNNIFQRMESLEIPCSFYGSNCYELCKSVRDGFQIQQNLEALGKANMSFVSTSRMVHVPDLVNEQWIDRFEMTVFLRREVLRSYPILNFLSSNGTIESVVNGNLKTVAWNTNR